MSFISVEPQPRVALESHSNTLLAQFDAQLRIIANRYLPFFEERRRIEVTYIDSLRKLHGKAKSVEASYDSRTEASTTRQAWDDLRDNLEREANIQQTFVDTLDNDVIKPLKILKESKAVTRKRIEKYLKRSAAKYSEHAENVISKLQAACWRKYQPQKHADTTDNSQRPQDVPNKRFGSKVSSLSLFRGRREDLREPAPVKPTQSEEVSDDDCRAAVSHLNTLRLIRAESLGDGYDSLEEFVFTPTVKNVFVNYMEGMVTTCGNFDDLAKSTGAKVEMALAGADASDLRASFRRALSFSVPPLTLYCNYHPGGYSNLIFGVPLLVLVDHETNEDTVPKVVRMCIEEVEKRGMNISNIYSSGSIYDTEVLELLRRFENEKPFSFSSTDKIHSVAALLRRYLWDLPEPLLELSLQEYRHYTQYRSRNTENDFSLLQPKIRELHPVHWATLEALLQHLLRVVSHSDTNGMTVEVLSTWFCYPVLCGDEVLEGGVNRLVMNDLIQNVQTLFDKRPSPSPPVPSPIIGETTFTHTYGSLFLTPDLPQLAVLETMGSATRQRPGPVDGIHTSPQSFFTSWPSDAPVESRLTPSPHALLSPLLGLSSNTLKEGVEMNTQEQVISEERGANAVESSPNSTPPDDLSPPVLTSASVAEWRLRQSLLPSHPEAMTTPQSPPESVLSGASEIPISSGTSLQTGMGRFL
ncbi:hypothetical protein EI94DRAFT_1804224 [Lactarius quietus]|nr:hypothetical protein EI94DRAFT_1804224 [Lactarius quietus]